jgi:pimeloyl-ACP methyl ester carboxylesterase
MLLEGRAIHEFGAFLGALPLLKLVPRGDGHSVLVLPGLIASDVSTRPLRAYLRDHGYDVHGWGLGRNLGPRPGIEQGMLDQIRQLRRGSGCKVSLIGWSLGGLYARQLAKKCPDDVRLVISLGSPFNGSPHATNAWRVYELASGRRADDQPMGSLREPPPVPTTAIFSRTDGICAWQCCVEEEGPQVENIEVQGSHCGLGHHPAVVYAVADRLAQPEGEWKPFDRSGWRSLAFPDPKRPR